MGRGTQHQLEAPRTSLKLRYQSRVGSKRLVSLVEEAKDGDVSLVCSLFLPGGRGEPDSRGLLDMQCDKGASGIYGLRDCLLPH